MSEDMKPSIREGDRTFTCPRHGEVMPCISQSEAEARGYAAEDMGCTACTQELLTAPDPATMTGDARADELLAILDRPLTVSLDVMYGRTEALVGRPLMTHEYAAPNILAAEARDWQHPGDPVGHAMGLMRDLVGDKPIIAIATQETDPE
jgi:hypothetical protein